MSLSVYTTFQYDILKFDTSHFWTLRLDTVASIFLFADLNMLILFLVRGGGSGDSVNLESVTSTQLSMA